MFTKFRGTLEYCSPEVHNGAKYRGPELDVWALGVTLYTVLFRENPFTASEVPGTLNDLPHPLTEGSNDAMTLLLGLLQPDPLKRFTVLRALSCDWLRQIVNLNDYSWCDMFGDVPVHSDSMYELDC
ncbi:unnamed protein product [Candidula unifasciata]|uniref:Protein kinase domain-containing protein n=1 Tax=Candidula unifasciata TaxID=100452 RepID=A0A8S3ZCQ0_9EUPU|nr:unnamed protein product [Candidula unifasciata]